MSDMGRLLPQRLKQLAETITGSPAKIFGLSNSVFGKVKEIRLSSYLNRTLDATPTPSPAYAPSPEENDHAEPSISPYLSRSPSYSPVSSPNFHHSPPCLNCDASSPSDDNFPYAPRPENGPHPSLPPISSSPAPSIVNLHSPCSSPHCGSTVPRSPSPASHSNPTAPTFSRHASAAYPPSTGPPSQLSPDLSPLPAVSYGSSPGQDKGNGKELLSPPPASLSISPLPSCNFCDSSLQGDLVVWLPWTPDIPSSVLVIVKICASYYRKYSFHAFYVQQLTVLLWHRMVEALVKKVIGRF
ncbi:leucine-rich repeat extensin-like protein 5 isoform X2 [Cornus florida]|nr:leucine-rich repeat extensin-like protein 5 isoform X2 [Cornus florida]